MNSHGRQLVNVNNLSRHRRINLIELVYDKIKV